MRIAVLTSGLLPVPALQGGVVENLVDFYLEFNEQKKIHHITVFSVIDKKIPKNLISNTLHTHYIFFRTARLSYKFKRKISWSLTSFMEAHHPIISGKYPPAGHSVYQYCNALPRTSAPHGPFLAISQDVQ